MAGMTYDSRCGAFSSPPQMNLPFEQIADNFLYESGGFVTTEQANGCSKIVAKNGWQLDICVDGVATFSIPEDDYTFVASKIPAANNRFNYSYNLFDYSEGQCLPMAILEQDCDGWAVFGDSVDAMYAISSAFYSSTGSEDELNFYKDYLIWYSPTPIIELTQKDYDPTMNSYLGYFYQNYF